MRCLALAVLGACSFSPGMLPGGGQDDARVDTRMIDMADEPDAPVDGRPDAGDLPGSVRRIDITDAQVMGGPHVDFPLLVSLTETWLRSMANAGDVARADGFDIFFSADQLGVTRLPFDVEAYDPTTGQLVVWVKVALAASTVIYIHYGDPAITTNQAAPTQVWTSYGLVVHYNGSGDSSGNNSVTGGVFAIAGKIGAARSYNGTTSVSNAGSAAAVDDPFVGGGTIESWFNVTAFGGGGFGRIMDKTVFGLFVDNSNASNTIDFFHTNSSGQYQWHFGAKLIATTTWHHVAIVFDSGNTANLPTAYVDGVAKTPTAVSTGAGPFGSDAAQTLYLGNSSGGTRGFDGGLDELRLSPGPRSENWLITQFRNHDNPAAFYTVSAPL